MEPANNNTLKFFHWALTAVLAAFAVTVIFEIVIPKYPVGLDAALVIVAALVSLIAVARQLPLQNVVLAGTIVAVVGGLAHGLSARTSIPFGPVTFNDTAGAKIFYVVPWPIPLIWITAIFSSRGVGRLILRPWRKIRSYGFWLIGVTAALTVAFDFALEPLAAHVKHFWIWQPTRIAATWHDAPILNFPAWAFVTLFMLAFATPALIKKKPGGPGATDYILPSVWLGALILFATGSARAGLWDAAIADAIIAVITVIFAARGARW